MSSRRQRRRESAGKGKKGRWLWYVAGGGVALTALAMGGGYLWARSWLHSDEFRGTLAQEAGKALEANEAELGAFRWSGGHLDTPSFDARGDKLVQEIHAHGLDVDMSIGALWRRTLRVEGARARSVQVRLDATAADERKDDAAEKDRSRKSRSGKWYDGLLPDRFELGGLEVDSSALSVATRSGTVAMQGVAWRIEPDQQQGSYKAEGSGGKLTLPWEWAPALELGRARLRYQDDAIFLSGADFALYGSGRLALTGEMSAKGDGYNFDGRLTGVDCERILSDDWKKRLTGRIDSEFAVTKGAAGPRVRGELELSEAVVTALPLLDTLSAYADTTRFRRLALQEARTDFEWEDGDLSLTRLTLSSEGLVRLEGSLKVTREGALDGIFRLGLVPGVLSHIPGAETDVFLPGERGLLWTSLRITGTREHPEEDLSQRLIDAAGARMFELLPETGQKVLKFTGRVGQNLAEGVRQGADKVEGAVVEGGAAVIDQGSRLIEGAGEVAKGAAGILDVFRGGEEEPEEKKKEETPRPERRR